MLQHHEFRRLHFRTFMVGIFLGILSAAIATALAIVTYLDFLHGPTKGKLFFACSVVFSVCQTFFAALLIRGNPLGKRGIMALFLLCLCVAFPALFYSPERWTLLAGIVSPLLGVLWVNTERYTRMCEALRSLHLYYLQTKDD